MTALREMREDVGVISTWMLRAPSLLLLFSAAPWSEDLMALATWGLGEEEEEEKKQRVHTYSADATWTEETTSW